MKKVLLVLFCFGIISCDGLLKEERYGTYSNENYYQTDKDARTALLYAYGPLRNIEYGSRFMFDIGSATTDEMRSYGKSAQTHRLEMMNWTFSPSSQVVTYFFKYAYMSITRANSVIENLANMDNISQEKKDKYIGESYFLRAFSYFNLVRVYGKIPLRKKAVDDINEVSTSYASIEEVYDLIIADLEKAIKLLSVEKMQGRADKVAAQALLSKVYATLASSKYTDAPKYGWVEDSEKMYQKAAKYAGDVLYDQSVYGLDPNLLNIYDVEHLDDSPEHIFTLSMNRDASGEEGNWSQLPQMFTISLPEVYVSSSLTDNNSGVQKMVENQTWGVYRVDSLFYKSFSDNDLRKKLMVTEIYNPDGSLLATWSPDNINSENSVENSFYYPFTRKYSDPQSENTTTSANPYFIRFADIALIYAEAKGNTPEGYKWINKVRKRANLSNLNKSLSLKEFRKAVWEERKYELAFEGHRLFELRRTNRVDVIQNKSINEDYAYFFPTPQREIDLNPKVD